MKKLLIIFVVFVSFFACEVTAEDAPNYYFKGYEHRNYNKDKWGHSVIVNFVYCGKYKDGKKYKNKLCRKDEYHNFKGTVEKKTRMNDEMSSLKWNLPPGEFITLYQDFKGGKAFFTVSESGKIKDFEKIGFGDCISSWKIYNGPSLGGKKPDDISPCRSKNNLLFSTPSVIKIEDFTDSCTEGISCLLKNKTQYRCSVKIEVTETTLSGKKNWSKNIVYTLNPYELKFIGCFRARTGLGGTVLRRYEIIKQSKM